MAYRPPSRRWPCVGREIKRAIEAFLYERSPRLCRGLQGMKGWRSTRGNEGRSRREKKVCLLRQLPLSRRQQAICPSALLRPAPHLPHSAPGSRRLPRGAAGTPQQLPTLPLLAMAHQSEYDFLFKVRDWGLGRAAGRFD